MDLNAIGREIRKQRRRHGLRQAELAALSGVGTRFVSDLENGKASLEIGRVVRVLNTVGLVVWVDTKSWGDYRQDYVR
jgi:HTH-type transcriptional regulator/antitoxin HipB